jgi:hypothetical protein
MFSTGTARVRQASSFCTDILLFQMLKLTDWALIKFRTLSHENSEQEMLGFRRFCPIGGDRGDFSERFKYVFFFSEYTQPFP